MMPGLWDVGLGLLGDLAPDVPKGPHSWRGSPCAPVLDGGGTTGTAGAEPVRTRGVPAKLLSVAFPATKRARAA